VLRNGLDVAGTLVGIIEDVPQLIDGLVDPQLEVDVDVGTPQYAPQLDDCEWSIYEGPLFIDFRLPVKWSVQDDRHRTPVAPEQIVLGNVDRLASGNVVEAIELERQKSPCGSPMIWNWYPAGLPLRSSKALRATPSPNK